jgi:hypothetical protein
MNRVLRSIPWIAALLCVAYVSSGLVPARPTRPPDWHNIVYNPR